MIAHLRTAFLKSFVWRGRASRPEFWWPWLVQLFVNAHVASLPGAAGWLGTALWLALLPMVVSAAVRRRHDRGRSALAVVVFLPAMIFFIGFLGLGAGPLFLASAPVPPGLGYLLDGLALLWLVFIRFLGLGAGPLFPASAPVPPGLGYLLDGLALLWLVFTVWLIVVLARAGDPGPNRYGPPCGALPAP